MTLTKAIEAVRESLKYTSAVLFLDHGYKEPKIPVVKHAYDVVEGILAALPDKPMTKQEVMKLIHHVLICGLFKSEKELADHMFRAPKAANVLYVEEK